MTLAAEVLSMVVAGLAFTVVNPAVAEEDAAQPGNGIRACVDCW